MNQNTGFIALHRKLLDWEWYKDINTKTLFIHILLKANHEDRKWQNIMIKKGSFLTSIGKLSEETGLSEQQTKTALKKLKSTSCITSKATNKYTVIFVTNYTQFQDSDTKVKASYQPAKQPAKQQTKNKEKQQRATTTNNLSSCTIVTRTCIQNSLSNDKHVEKSDDFIDVGKTDIQKSKINDVGSREDAFNIVWAHYPLKDGKKKALSHFNATVKSRQDFQDICEALRRYMRFVEDFRRKGGKRNWKNGATFFNNWKDWVDFEPPVEEEQKSFKKQKEEEFFRKMMEKESEPEAKTTEGIKIL